ncbi:replicative DNA helicase [Oceanobacillus arenosus]|uniref:Replicative DNA helicase n=1 Tax=Oceanobacillus arenosus TaxID=1229153 RepID=A0A3D8PPY5_9BACI|nr:replicative DNA helicase [Oceanobacillus arenosus]RDW17095.1 replicative DNA helicase [Oceanobacillus arenosus]
MPIENYEAEVAVLGSVLLDGTLFKDLEVQEEHFHDSRHRRIYRAMQLASEKDAFIDVVVVTTRLGDAIEQVGNTSYLLEMAESVASTSAIKHYERLVFDAYRMRKSRESVTQYLSNSSDEELGVLIEQLQVIQAAGAISQEKSVYDHLQDIAGEMFHPERMQQGCMTSYEQLDNMTGGLQRGDLLIVAARPSVGKTAFALNLAAGHCKQGGSAQVFSLEMGTKQLLHRMLSAEGAINGRKWRTTAFTDEDYQRAVQAIGVISNWSLDVYDKKRTLLEIRSAVRKKVQDNPDGNHLIIIDYLQLITPAKQRERRDLEVGEITRELKQLAIELHIPILLISQLSRNVESRQNKRPLMSDLRESGNIEQDADVIFFLYREDYYEKNPEQNNRMEVIISKHRNGPTGTVELVFEKEYGWFGDVG